MNDNRPSALTADQEKRFARALTSRYGQSIMPIVVAWRRGNLYRVIDRESGTYIDAELRNNRVHVVSEHPEF
jgi:hypothetical protein